MAKPVYADEKIQNELHDIYIQYHNSIKVFVAQLECLQNKFPVEILNEIRAVFSHIAKIYADSNEDIANENIIKAKGHMKRAQLDAYKYMCYALLKYYDNFRELYRAVDLSDVNNGEFIIELSNLHNKAEQWLIEAKRIENSSDDSADSYGAYETAYNFYGQLYKLIIENLKHINKLQQKEKLQSDELNKQIENLRSDNGLMVTQLQKLQHDIKAEKTKNKIVTWVSIILAVTSVVLGFLALH